MPHCAISPQLELYYITNTPNNDVAHFDKSKPTIMLLHPVALDSSWLRVHFEDSRLNSQYNMIAFDQRNAGKTKSPYSARRDSNVDAADLAFAHELLKLPPVHIFGAQMNSVWAALRFSILFPDKCLSLGLCGIPADIPPDWIHKAFSELIDIWCFPPDLDTFEEAVMEMSYFLFDGQIPSELQDKVVEWWYRHIPPRRRRSVIELTVGRGPPTAKEYSYVNHPTLMMTGETSRAHPPSDAIKMHEKIPGSQFFVVKGGPEMFQILPQYSSITNRVYANFLARLPPPPAVTTSPAKPSISRIGAAALQRLAMIADDPSIAQRDPNDPLSFSMWPPHIVTRNQEFLDQMEHGESEAFSPVDAQGKPLRKFSRRHDDQWTKAAFENMQNSVQAIRGIQVQNHA